MKTIKVFEAFSGIGAQKRSIDNINKREKRKIFKVVATSDWDIRANIVYSAIHHGLSVEKIQKILTKHNLLTKEQQLEFLKNKTYSVDSKKPVKNISKYSNELIKYLIVSELIMNNYCDITKINPKEIESLGVNLITYSFPCQGLSVANMGRSKGIINSESTSHLIWEIGRILENMNNKPEYLLLENVKALVKKYKSEYEIWKSFLDRQGYKTFTAVFNASHHGSLQERERVFAISVLKNIKTPFTNDQEFFNFVEQIGKKHIVKDRQSEYLRIFDIKNARVDESIDALMNNTPSRIKMVNENNHLYKLDIQQKRNWKINTLTTKQDRNPNSGVIQFENSIEGKLNHRFITAREAYKIMGFNDEDYEKVKVLKSKNLVNNTHLYRQAGNSIDVNVLTSILETIKKINDVNQDEGVKNGK
ncbi:DNA (cytosine-5-)-methyltransferase [Mycoplasmopsis lipofaciens]|uniref:DNA (cytosine-5-)-methyltransferase n=1 Tax=Mycoplasmopsis lipofaciens TaxID=114884 RepID=UPI0004843405|nr:DNA (cytosine-5-)-methyltransferase [Mycoplasmopsis lipofaciens]